MDDKLGVTGHIDFIADLSKIYGVDEPILGEIKTTGYSEIPDEYGRIFRRHKMDTVAKGPLKYHLSQGNLYMYLTDLKFELFI